MHVREETAPLAVVPVLRPKLRLVSERRAQVSQRARGHGTVERAHVFGVRREGTLGIPIGIPSAPATNIIARRFFGGADGPAWAWPSPSAGYRSTARESLYRNPAAERMTRASSSRPSWHSKSASSIFAARRLRFPRLARGPSGVVLGTRGRRGGRGVGGASKESLDHDEIGTGSRELLGASSGGEEGGGGLRETRSAFRASLREPRASWNARRHSRASRASALRRMARARCERALCACATARNACAQRSKSTGAPDPARDSA